MSTTDVLITLTEAELKDTRGLSLVGLLKWLLEPALSTAVYVLLVQVALRNTQPAYPLFVLSAVLPWRYFQDSVGRGLGLVSSYGNLITARRLPRGVLPLVAVATQGASLLMGMVLLVPLMLWYSAPFTAALLLLPIVVAVVTVFVSGPTYLASVFGLHMPDYRGPIQSVMRLGFLVSTALVPPGRVGGSGAAWLFRYNPMSGIFDSFRAIVMAGRAPRAVDLLYPLAVGVVLLVIGRAVYLWWEPQMAKEV
ncbi:MAG: lipopolysaccharide transport system permease protein [Acidimicrobiaceae bacterium]